LQKFLFLILFFNTLIFADNVITINTKDSYSIGKSVAYFIDRSNKTTLQEVQSKHFTNYNKEIINFSFLQPTYWFTFKLKYDQDQIAKKWWLYIDYPHLDFVSLYILNENNETIFHQKGGDLELIAKEQLRHNNLLFSLPKSSVEVYTYYLRVETSGSVLLPLQIISNSKLLEESNFAKILSGLYYGILMILILYTLVTFLATKEKVYGFYILFILSYGLWQLSYDGLGILYFWGDSYWMREKATVFFIFTSTFFLLLFSKTLLKAKLHMPRYNRFLLEPLTYIAIIGIVASVVLPYKYIIVLGSLLSIIVSVSLFIGGLIVLKKDYYSIRLFVLGWTIFLTATVLFVLSKFNFIDGYIVMQYGQQIGSAIELTLFSGALMQHFNNLKNEYTKKLKDHNKNLEEMVAQALQKERQNDQILIEQSKLASMGEMIEQIAHQWRQPLNNIGLINQDFYFKKELNKLQEEDYKRLHTLIDTNISYMSDTIDDFRNYYTRNQAKEIYDLHDAIGTILHIVEATFKHYRIKISLDIEKNIYVYNIKNELFQVFLNILNNAKDVLLSQGITDKKITIRLNKNRDFAFVKIEDNGGGVSEKIISKIFKPYFTTKSQKNGTGIGLYMSKEIIEKNMLGTLEVENINEGCCFSIQLPLHKKDS